MATRQNSIKKTEPPSSKAGCHLQWKVEMGGDSLPGKEALFMSVDIHNSEGYVDPTAFAAISGIERELAAPQILPFCRGERLYPYRTAPAVPTVYE